MDIKRLQTVLAGLVLLTAGCGKRIFLITTSDASGGGAGQGGDMGGAGGAGGGGGAGEPCPGQCVPLGPAIDWAEHPILLWIGDKNQAPTKCPARAPTDGYSGYADLDSPND